MKPKIKTLKRTILACPASFEGETSDGKFIYIRYRNGNLRAGIWETEKAMWKEMPWVFNVFSGKVGKDLDGWLNYEKLKELLKEQLDFSETTYEDNFVDEPYYGDKF